MHFLFLKTGNNPMLIETIKTLSMIALMVGWMVSISELSLMSSGTEVENFYSQRLQYTLPDAQKQARARQVQQWASQNLYQGNLLTQAFIDDSTKLNTKKVGTSTKAIETQRSFVLPKLFAFALSGLSEHCQQEAPPSSTQESTLTLCTQQGTVQ
jgi:hypothetical protein